MARETIDSTTDADHAKFLQVIESSMDISNKEDFLNWVQTELQEILPHGKLACGVGVPGKCGFQAHHVIGSNFPDEYVKTLLQLNGHIDSPIISEWLKKRQPILFDLESDLSKTITTSEWKENFQRSGLNNIAAHGVCYENDRTGTYFSFSDIPVPLNQGFSRKLKLLIPHLHVALMRVVSSPSFLKKQKPTNTFNLSTREIEVLKWMSSGKSNWEIAQVLDLSESTVRNHVHHILGKLCVSSRAQAVSKAISLKLIKAKS